MLESLTIPLPSPSGDLPDLVFIGTGYLGATHAICFAALGHQVLGLEKDEAKVAKLNGGELPFSEPHLEELLHTALASGRLRFTSSYQEAADFGDVHFLCVGTPQQRHGRAADLRYLHEATRALAPLLQRKALIVGKSTVPVGTAAQIGRSIAELSPHPDLVDVAWSPEFLREGFAVQDVLRPDRLVFGTRSEPALTRLRGAYQALYDLAAHEGRELPTIVTSPETAELTKLAANSFLATKISFINAMADVCDASGGDVTALAAGLGLDPRIGPGFLRAGIGFGGGCLPKDIRAFQASAAALGVGESLRFLEEIDLVNQRRCSKVLELARRATDGLKDRRIAVLGATFKPDSDDIRDSPALLLIGELAAAGASVRVYDPAGMDNARRAVPGVHYAPTMMDAVQDAELVCLFTEWDEFRTADPHALAEAVHSRRIIDGRNCLDPERWRAAGWTYLALGRPATAAAGNTI